MWKPGTPFVARRMAIKQAAAPPYRRNTAPRGSRRVALSITPYPIWEIRRPVRYSPVCPSMDSRIRSAWPLCRPYSSIMWHRIHRRLGAVSRRFPGSRGLASLEPLGEPRVLHKGQVLQHPADGHRRGGDPHVEALSVKPGAFPGERGTLEFEKSDDRV